MKAIITDHIKTAVDALQQQQVLPPSTDISIQLERTRTPAHGDFACNIALILAKQAKLAPRALAEQLVAHLPTSPDIEKVELAGPGFINFHLTPAARLRVVSEIQAAKANYGRSHYGQNKQVLVEFVSSNPTGPLHVGHGRGAALGASIANLLEAVGYHVIREYYVNDAGRQMDILTTSIWLRYLALCGETFTLPSNIYKGEYVIDIAKTLHAEIGEKWCYPAVEVFANTPLDETPDNPTGDKEAYIDAVIANTKKILGAENYLHIFDLGLNHILADIQDDLAGLAITFDNWYSERSLTQGGALNRVLDKLRAQGHLYEKDGAKWFRATDFGDEKDRVLVRANGTHTYFCSDIAYHLTKIERGAEWLIDVLGSDHHGYVRRIQGGVAAMGYPHVPFDTTLVQFAILYRGKERVQMSTRSGSFVTLRELREEVGKDAVRFFYVMRKADQHMDFDLELAKAEKNDNPVYYIQYAHARVCSVFKQLSEAGLVFDELTGCLNLILLTEPHEQAVLRLLAQYEEVLEGAALALEPHRLAQYLRELADAFHGYYSAHKFIVDSIPLRNARLCLIQAVRVLIHNGLTLLGVSAPEVM